jgi:hypothetical protein
MFFTVDQHFCTMFTFFWNTKEEESASRWSGTRRLKECRWRFIHHSIFTTWHCCVQERERWDPNRKFSYMYASSGMETRCPGVMSPWTSYSASLSNLDRVRARANRASDGRPLALSIEDHPALPRQDPLLSVSMRISRRTLSWALCAWGPHFESILITNIYYFRSEEFVESWNRHKKSIMGSVQVVVIVLSPCPRGLRRRCDLTRPSDPLKKHRRILSSWPLNCQTGRRPRPMILHI